MDTPISYVQNSVHGTGSESNMDDRDLISGPDNTAATGILDFWGKVGGGSRGGGPGPDGVNVKNIICFLTKTT